MGNLSVQKKKKPKMPSTKPTDWDDTCFNCGEDGELVMCDFSRSPNHGGFKCNKAYHLACISETQVPKGIVNRKEFGRAKSHEQFHAALQCLMSNSSRTMFLLCSYEITI